MEPACWVLRVKTLDAVQSSSYSFVAQLGPTARVGKLRARAVQKAGFDASCFVYRSGRRLCDTWLRRAASCAFLVGPNDTSRTLP